LDRRPTGRSRRHRTWTAAARSLPLALALAACASHAPPPDPPVSDAKPSEEAYRRADAARIQMLEQRVALLTADLQSAEETLLSIESGLRGAQTRSEAVSRLAEARIQVDKAAKQVGWRSENVAEARAKLAEADRQLEQDHTGAAIFFASRAARIARGLLTEADAVSHAADVRFVRADRVNLRAEPSKDGTVVAVLPSDLPVFPEHDGDGGWVLVRTVNGDLGWVYASLLRGR
jgi:hypothetical protein